jgi:hypothetical protein
MWLDRPKRALWHQMELNAIQTVISDHHGSPLAFRLCFEPHH